MFLRGTRQAGDDEMSGLHRHYFVPCVVWKYRQLCQAVGAFIYSTHMVWVHSPLQIYKSGCPCLQSQGLRCDWTFWRGSKSHLVAFTVTRSQPRWTCEIFNWHFSQHSSTPSIKHQPREHLLEVLCLLLQLAFQRIAETAHGDATS